MNKNKGVLTVSGIQPGRTTVIQAVNHNDHTQVYEKLYLDIKPRLDARKVYPTAVSILNSKGQISQTPTNLPDTGTLQLLLEKVFGAQANVHFNVQPLQRTSLNYDLNRDGKLQGSVEGQPPSNEEVLLGQEVVSFYCPDAANCTIDPDGFLPIYVRAISTSDPGNTPGDQHNEFIQDTHIDSTEITTTHEIGHSLGLNDICPLSTSLQCLQTNPSDTDRIMWHFDGTRTGSGCRLIKSEWDVINK